MTYYGKVRVTSNINADHIIRATITSVETLKDYWCWDKSPSWVFYLQ